ncbi:MAG: hypothetical protein JWM80_2325 [Cyanobacteria bacterium RYN_339]|nr:hypothetical protein [Cyanobacteria bacterium RYN_339]
MAKRHNMKAEKAKRNAEYALKYKKKKRAPVRRSATFTSSTPDGATATAVAPRMAGHDAICSACGVATTLPFKPVSGKPVFCRPCFLKEAG